MVILGDFIQVIVALGILNVWLLRAGKTTPYRGGEATTLRQEFAVYGLPGPAMYGVGFLKIGAALALIAGVWVPVLVLPAAATLGALMVGAILMHVKVKDPVRRSVPALTVLLGCVLIVLLHLVG